MALLLEILQGCWNTLRQMAPFLLLGFFLAGVFSVLLPVRWVKRHLARQGKTSVLKSALFGIPLPLCSCGVLPVATWIRHHGASKGATGAFLLATPQTGVDGFLVAWAMLGAGMAFYIPLAALVSGVILGMVLNRFPDSERPALAMEEEQAKTVRGIPARIFHHGFVTIAGDIAVPLALGIFLAGLIGVFVGESQFATMGSGFLAKLAVVAVATPLYVCATASIPIGATMLMAGLSPGTVFVFLMAGPATNAATFTTIARLVGKREALAYLACTLALAFGMGILLDLLAPALDLRMRVQAHCHAALGVGHHVAAASLLGILAYGKYRRMRDP